MPTLLLAKSMDITSFIVGCTVHLTCEMYHRARYLSRALSDSRTRASVRAGGSGREAATGLFTLAVILVGTAPASTASAVVRLDARTCELPHVSNPRILLRAACNGAACGLGTSGERDGGTETKGTDETDATRAASIRGRHRWWRRHPPDRREPQATCPADTRPDQGDGGPRRRNCPRDRHRSW